MVKHKASRRHGRLLLKYIAVDMTVQYVFMICDSYCSTISAFIAWRVPAWMRMKYVPLES